MSNPLPPTTDFFIPNRSINGVNRFSNIALMPPNIYGGGTTMAQIVQDFAVGTTLINGNTQTTASELLLGDYVYLSSVATQGAYKSDTAADYQWHQLGTVVGGTQFPGQDFLFNGIETDTVAFGGMWGTRAAYRPLAPVTDNPKWTANARVWVATMGQVMVLANTDNNFSYGAILGAYDTEAGRVDAIADPADYPGNGIGISLHTNNPPGTVPVNMVLRYF